MALAGLLAMPCSASAGNSDAKKRPSSGEILVQVIAREQVTVASPMDGKVIQIPFREGDKFRKGALLLGFDSVTEQGRYDRATAVLNLAEKNSDIQLKLYQMGSSSTMEVSTAKAELGKARAEASIELEALKKCQVIAPFSGGVSEMHVQRFQTVKKGDPLMRIVNTGNLEIQMFVPSKWLKWLKKGQLFKVWIDELDRQYDAEVRATGVSIDAVSQSVSIFGRFRGNNPELLPGMSGHAIFDAPKP
ncbi:MAG: efflux RND transporter periplasmic adaptor subunit [Chlorobiaceae bacterium]|nr:efflux RND transporter periplasmic adaptor subunit [Chlorobiaceae bacterium]